MHSPAFTALNTAVQRKKKQPRQFENRDTCEFIDVDKSAQKKYSYKMYLLQF